MRLQNESVDRKNRKSTKKKWFPLLKYHIFYVFQTVYDAYATTSGSKMVPNNGLYTTSRYHHRSPGEYRSLYSNGINGSNGTNGTNGSIASDPKSSPYSNGGVKPVPPPKPKSYPNYAGSKNYSSSLYMNSERSDVDSGQGSSLDRDYGIYNNTEPRYSNPPPTYYSMDGQHHHQNGHNGHNNGHNGQNGHANGHNTDQHQLDLTNNREYRGSAFELYKKPLHLTTNSSPQQYQNSIW